MKTWSICLALLFTVAGCISRGDSINTLIGDSKPLGQGTVRSWVSTDDAGVPTAIGITLTASALEGLPEGGDHSVNETVLALPQAGAPVPFDHISVDWNPQGHEPPDVYDVAHFDVHFYMMNAEERDAITPADLAYEAKLAKTPATAFIPARYVPTPGGVPRMGAHWVDPATPELNGETFTYTFLYGFYDGRMNFLEPMITKAFLETRPDLTLPVRQPEQFERSGYYPTHYSIRYDAERNEYSIVLEGLTHRQGRSVRS